MGKSEKVYNLKIVLTLIGSLFLSAPMLYSYDASLRVPVDNSAYRRMGSVIAKQDRPESEFKINITDKVWNRLNYSVFQLKQSIKRINPSAEITEIIVNDCSLIRDVMVDGSDIDEMYIGVDGIHDQDILDSLTNEFANNIEMEGLEIYGSNKMPRIVPHSVLEKKKEILLAQKKHIMIIYRKGEFLTRDELFREGRFPLNQLDKYIARVKFLLLAGEMDIERAKMLLDKIRMDILAGHDYGNFYEELKACVSNYDSLMLSRPALDLAVRLQRILSDPIKACEVQEDRAQEFEDALFELCDKNLVRIFDNKLIVLWKVHSPRWSDAFWDDQIVVKEKDKGASSGSAIIGRVVKRLRRNTDGAPSGGIMALLESRSIFDSAEAQAIIRKNIGFYENDILSRLKGMLKNKDLSSIYSKAASTSQYILRLLPYIVFSNTDKADAIAGYIYKESLLEDKPEYIVYSSIEAMAAILPYIKDKALYEGIIDKLEKFKKSNFEWIQELAAKTLISAEITRQVRTCSKEEAAALLKDKPYLVVYNKGMARVLKKDGKVIIEEELGSVGRAIADFLKKTGGGIVVCSAITSEEKAIAATNRLVEAGENTYIRFIAHPKGEYEKFNNQFSNPFLWLLHHEMVDRMQGSSHEEQGVSMEWVRETYAGYKKVNHRIAKGIFELTQVLPNARIFYHDFHIYPVPGALRLLGDESSVSSHFIHVPWPSAGYLIENVPDSIMRELLEGVLSNAVVGFHTKEYAYNFMRACEEILGARIDYNSRTILYNGRNILVQVNPISIDINNACESAKQEETLRAVQRLKGKMKGKIVIGRYERIDITKGIMEGFAAVRILLQQHPELRKKIIVYCSFEPYRQDVELYRRLTEEAERAVIAINKEFSPEVAWNGIFRTPEEENERLKADWPVIVMDLKPKKTLFVSCLVSDVFLVNPLIDGMNLVAKLYAVLNNPQFLQELNRPLQNIFGEEAFELTPGAMVVSKNIGAREEVNSGALLVDPYNIQDIADALYDAINMNGLERAERAELTAQQVSRNTHIDWSFRLLNGIDIALSKFAAGMAVHISENKTDTSL